MRVVIQLCSKQEQVNAHNILKAHAPTSLMSLHSIDTSLYCGELTRPLQFFWSGLARKTTRTGLVLKIKVHCFHIGEAAHGSGKQAYSGTEQKKLISWHQMIHSKLKVIATTWCRGNYCCEQSELEGAARGQGL